MSDVTVIKCNFRGEEVYRWTGQSIERSDSRILLEAHFGLSGHGKQPLDDPSFFVDIPVYFGDRFVERYYSNCWYNSYEIHDRESDQIKCWYCNVTYPAKFTSDTIVFRDLALDLLVYPDGRQKVLDEVEFEELEILPEDKTRALAALEELKGIFLRKFQK
jgi:hypothetical protein